MITVALRIRHWTASGARCEVRVSKAVKCVNLASIGSFITFTIAIQAPQRLGLPVDWLFKMSQGVVL